MLVSRLSFARPLYIYIYIRSSYILVNGNGVKETTKFARVAGFFLSRRCSHEAYCGISFAVAIFVTDRLIMCPGTSRNPQLARYEKTKLCAAACGGDDVNTVGDAPRGVHRAISLIERAESRAKPTPAPRSVYAQLLGETRRGQVYPR